ncbi:hypothetical protein QTP88_019404 [Uroleucon formosanum]
MASDPLIANYGTLDEVDQVDNLNMLELTLVDNFELVGNNESKKDLSSSSSELFLEASKNSSSNASVFCFLGPVFFFFSMVHL